MSFLLQEMISRSLNPLSTANHSVRMSSGFKGDDRMSEEQLATKPTLAREPNRKHSSIELAARPALEFKNATRVQDSVTSVLERRALLWLAEHLPSWVSCDQLTFLGFVAMLLAGCSYFLARWHPVGLLLATMFLALNWFGDSLDGTLARVRNRQRPRYGFYVDHMIDSFGALFLMAGLGLSGYVEWRIAMGLLVAFLLLSIETYLASYTLGVFKLSFAKLGPTEIRILLGLGNFVLWLHPNMRVPGLSWRLFDFAGLVAIPTMGIMVVTAAMWHTAELYRQETHPQ
jgi:archaetidylinositol phosphate synthase